MKKIYLFDDNQHGQMSKNYRFDFIQKLKEYDFVLYFSVGQTIDWDDTACVMIHDSFPDSDYRENLIKIAKPKNIPYVIFSNGCIQTTLLQKDLIKIGIQGMKKDRFYDNLTDFLERYKNGNEIDLEILALSKRYVIRKTPIIISEFNNILFGKNEFSYNDLFGITGEPYKYLKELFYFCYNGNAEQEFEKYEHEVYDTIVQSNDFKSKINELSNQIRIKYNE